MPLPSDDVMPDGSQYTSWEQAPAWRKTYHVAQGHAEASDDSDGSAERPWKTVSKAAATLQPGERVVIHEGIYRELVRPAHGGTGPDAMIGYEAAPGETVIITGAEVWQGEWRASRGWRHEGPDIPAMPPQDLDAQVWMGELPADKLVGVNPFGMCNVTKNARHRRNIRRSLVEHGTDDYWMRRGLLFVDGQPLTQVLDYPELFAYPGTYWVEDCGRMIHFRLLDDGDPREHTIEFTARDQALSPAQPYLGYIAIKGIRLERVGNGYAVPQRGALSTYCGHHWVIEDCDVRWANTIGIDIGHQTWYRESDEESGHHIVRDNHVSDCGQCGICGTVGGRERALPNTLIEGNVIERCAWHDVERLFESAGIKLHGCRNTIVRRNVVRDTVYGSGIWLDFANQNSRVTGNIIFDTRNTLFGAIFFEASHDTNQIDNNVIWGVGLNRTASDRGGYGIYEHDCDHLIIEHNLVAHCDGAAVYLNLGQVDRISQGRGSTGRKHSVRRNILTDSAAAIVFPTPDNHADENVLGHFTEPGAFRIQRPYERLDLQAWREFHGWGEGSRESEVRARLNLDKRRLDLYVDTGERVVKRKIMLDDSFDLRVVFEAEEE